MVLHKQREQYFLRDKDWSTGSNSNETIKHYIQKRYPCIFGEKSQKYQKKISKKFCLNTGVKKVSRSHISRTTYYKKNKNFLHCRNTVN